MTITTTTTMKPIKIASTQSLNKWREAAEIAARYDNDHTKKTRDDARLAILKEFGASKASRIIDDTNGRATTHTLSADDVINEALRTERALRTDYGLSQKDVCGITIDITSGGPTANAYGRKSRGTCIQSHARLERRPSGWYLTAYYRVERWPGPANTEHRMVTLPKSTRDVIADKYMRRKFTSVTTTD